MTFVPLRRTPVTLLAGVLTMLVATFAAAMPSASAHDPIFFSDDQKTPDIGPFMPDGTTSWALYGQVLDPGDTRGFEFDLRDGDELYISLLIPNLSPELDLSDAELPVVELESPSGEVRTLVPEVREVFDEPFSRTSYVTLNELREPAEAGRYRGLVISNAPARFAVAIGENEIFFTETERTGDRPSSFAEITAPLQAWYTTPPGADAPLDAELAEGEAEIDLDMIEEAMETGEGSIEGEGSIRGEEAEEAAIGAEDQPAAESTEGEQEEPEPAEVEAESETETASATAEAADSGSSNGWVAPVVIAVAAALGAGFFLNRRRGSGES